MRQPLPVRGHQLGWIRVAVALAVTGTTPDDPAVAAWLEAHPRHPQLTPGLLSAPSQLARALGFLDDALGATDAGRVLHWIESPQGAPDADLLTLSLPLRWLLWAGSANAEPAFWRAALSTWQQEADLRRRANLFVDHRLRVWLTTTQARGSTPSRTNGATR